MNRRRFLASAAASAALAPVRSLLALAADDVYRNTIGLQLYTLRNEIKKDVGATLKAVSDAGYKQGEMYGFPACDDMVKAARDAGLALHSTHFDWETVVAPKDEAMSDFQRIVEKARATGLTHLVIPYLHDHQRKTLEDYKRIAGQANRAAALAKAAGLQLAYHNHAFEFEPRENGKTGYDIFMAEFAPEMKFEVDVFWVKAGGVDPAALIRKLAGRVSQLHLKDLKEGIALPAYGSLPNDAFQELGDGIIPMEPILAAAREAGVAICHVEQDQSPDPLASIRQSMAYLKRM